MGLKLKLVPYQNVPILQLMMFTTTPQRTTVIMDTTGMVSLIKMEIMDRPHTMVITGIVEIITKRKAQEIEETEKKKWEPWTCGKCDCFNEAEATKCANCGKPFKFSEDLSQETKLKFLNGKHYQEGEEMHNQDIVGDMYEDVIVFNNSFIVGNGDDNGYNGDANGENGDHLNDDEDEDDEDDEDEVDGGVSETVKNVF